MARNERARGHAACADGCDRAAARTAATGAGDARGESIALQVTHRQNVAARHPVADRMPRTRDAQRGCKYGDAIRSGAFVAGKKDTSIEKVGLTSRSAARR